MPKTKPISTPKTDNQRTLLQSEERFRTLIEQSTDAIQMLDENGRIIFSSDSLKTVLGYSPKEVEGGSPPDYIHPDDLAYFNEKVAELMQKPGHQIHVEYRVRHKNGNWVWLEVVGVNHLENPAIKALVGNFRDITERKEIEAALRESEAELRFMAESLPQKIFTAGPEGKVKYFNRQWAEYLGVPLDKILQEGVRQYIHPDDLPGNMESWRNTVKTGNGSQTEQRLRRHDGQYRRHISHVRPMLDDKGSVIRWFGSMTDIEDVHRTSERNDELEKITTALKQQRAELIDLSRAKDEFISLASHQLRTPATGVKQYLGMILEGFAGDDIPDTVLNMIEVAYASNERQLKIVNDLLKVAYVDAGKLKIIKESCDMKLLLDEVVAECASVTDERDQTVEVIGGCETCKVDADPRLMRMVMENLIDNASKYSLKGKKITAELKCTPKLLSLGITDQGVGIGKDDLKQLFRKFSRIDNALSTLVGGTGLGLYWAKQVVELHGGTIRVKSKVDKGSTFTMQIPLA